MQSLSFSVTLLLYVTCVILTIASSVAGADLGEPCNDSTNLCKSEDNLVCSSGFCVCDQYSIEYPSESGDNCDGGTVGTRSCLQRKYVNSKNKYCNVDRQCSEGGFGPLSFCNKDKHVCECKPEAVLFSDGKCVAKARELGDNCVMDEQCGDHLFSVCVPNLQGAKCGCIATHVPGKYRVGDQRIRCIESATKIGQSCAASDDQCGQRLLPNTICVANKCQCQDGYIKKEDETGCLKKVEEIGVEGSCEEDGQCQAPNTMCLTTNCTCIAGYAPSETNKKVCIEVRTNFFFHGIILVFGTLFIFLTYHFVDTHRLSTKLDPSAAKIRNVVAASSGNSRSAPPRKNASAYLATF